MTAPNDGQQLDTLGPIQIIPSGLLGLLQLKQLGALPSELSRVVDFTIEARDWYFQSRRLNEQALFGGQPATISLITATGPGPQTFSGGSGPATVPAGQTWYVEAAAAGFALAAADTIHCALATMDNTGHNVVPVGVDYLDTVTARARNGFCKADRGFWMNPGDQLLLLVYDILSAGGVTVTLRLRATPMPL